MEITLQGGSGRTDGFGITHEKIRESIERIGIPIVPDGDVNFNFTHPHWGKYSDNKLDVLYFPWESTGMMDGWRKHFSLFDEIWVTSPWLKNVTESWGYRDVHVYEHGLDPIWTPELRESPVSGPFTFLMVGFEALRKGGLEALRGFRRAFGDSPDVQLVIKTKSSGLGNIYPNVKFVTGELSFKEMVALTKSAHAVIAPTYGEGYGIPTRDAMACGIPVITTAGFLPYEDYVHNDLLIPSTLIDSPWPDVHPGQMYQPHQDSLIDQIKLLYSDYDRYARWQAYEAKYLIKNYQWDDLTKNAFFALESRL